MSVVLPSRGQTRRLALYGTEGVVGRCRDFSRDALIDWEWIPAADEDGQAVVEDVLLLVSEVVTNACLHAHGPQELMLHCSPDRLRIEVTDDSPVHPRPRPFAAAVPGGHGLVVLDRLARSWGSVPRGTGKAVWVEVAAPTRLQGTRQQ
ncbi:ATP-binding protein [Streptomyces sp. NPDC019443]|uniref:ATP-binding protein n=1 Tax=Streptomyces sp. NPDC019443 TaxID=3365061 RepID=UPI0037906E90